MRLALIELIDEKAFEQISVREVAARAGVTFPTFYRQFATKEALLGEIAIDELSQMLATSRVGQTDVATSAEAICDHVKARRALWTALLTSSAAAVMRDEFVELTRQQVKDDERINPELPADMIASVVVSSMFEILAWWLRQAEGYPSARTAQYLEHLALTPAMSRHTLRST